MTPSRLRALLERGGGPVGALAGLERGLASAVLCERASADELPARTALARIWQETARTDRVDQLLAERAHPRVRRRTAGLSRSTRSRTARRCCSPRATRPRRSPAAGSRSSARGRRRPTGSPTRTSSARCSPGRGSPWSAGSPSGSTPPRTRARSTPAARSSACSAPGSTSCTRAGTARCSSACAASGLLVSELGYGVQPRREAFPVRNRIIAGLAELVVVVEATLKGGARITAERALEYGRTVMAYPGSRRNPSAAGTNSLLYDGASVVLEPSDVLVAARVRPARAAARLPRAAGRRRRRGARGLPRRAGHARPARESRRAHAVGGGRRGARARARRVDGTRPRAVLAAMNAVASTRR